MDPRPLDEAFVLEHSGFVRELARALVFDVDLARDVEQQTWLAALRHAPRESHSARSWLAAVVRNNAFQLFRNRRRRTAREGAVAVNEDQGLGDCAAPEEWLAREELRRQIVSAVDGLDEPWRSTLIRRYFDELTPQQVAERTGTSLETVRSRLKRAHALLRERLERRSGRSSLSLSLALVEAWRLTPPAGEGLAGGVAAWFTQWSLIVGTAQKLSIAAAVVVLGWLGLTWATRDSVAPQPAEKAPGTAAVVELERASSPDRHFAPGEPSERREAAEPRRSAPSDQAQVATMAPTEGSLELEFVWASDESPASAVGALLVPAGAADRQAEAIEIRSDERGFALVSGLSPGRVLIQLDRGGAQLAQVVAGERRRERVELEAGVRLRGRTLDSAGRPVAGAQIELHAGVGPDLGGWVVARSDAEGAYEVRGVSLDFGARLAARAVGYGPSRRVLLPQRGEVEELREDLVLGDLAGSLRGRVVDRDGEPVSGATLILGQLEDRGLLHSADGRQTLSAGPVRTRTASDGSFVFDAATPGAAPLVVRARGFAPLQTSVRVDAQAQALDLVLEHATRVHGRVRNDSGEPVFDARVSIGRLGEFSSCEARSREDGSFELDSAPVDEFEIEVAHDAHGRASELLHGAPGAQLEWNPVLSLGRVLRVRVAAPAAKLPHYWVRVDARGHGGSYFRVLTPDADGRVAFPQCPDGPLHVELIDTLANSDAPCAVYPELFADGIEVVLRPDSALAPSASVRGRVVDGLGVGIGGARVTLTRVGDAPVELATASDGAFESPRLPALRMALLVEAEGFAPRDAPALALQPSQQLDVGELVLHRAASLIARLRRGAGVSSDPRLIVLTDAGGRDYVLNVIEGVARSGALAPGRYSIRGADRSAAVAPLEVELAEGERRELDLDTELGVEVALAVETSAGQRPDATVDFVLRQAGALVRTGRFRDDAPARLVTRLSPGEYAFIVSLDDGRSARLELLVADRSLERTLVVE